MYIPNQLKNIVNLPNLDNVRNNMIDVLYQSVCQYIEDKEMFSIDDFSYAFFDEYLFETNCNKEIFSNIYLIIDQPNNIKIKKISNKQKNKIELPELYLTLENIRDGLLGSMASILDSSNMLWTTEYSVAIKCTIFDEDHGINNYYFNIIPCLKYYNKDDIEGVMYKYNGGVQIEYPLLAATNYFNKNELTDDIYRQTILIFKNILLQEKDIDKIPSEIIETVLYNVPTEMFLDVNKDTIIRIINYLRNFSVKDYQTLDEQDYAFTSIYRAMSPFYVKHILKLIEKFFINN